MGEFGAEYAALGLYGLLAAIFVIGLLAAHHLQRPRSQGVTHDEPVDLGAHVPAQPDASLGEQLYRIAISFLVFLAALVLIFPWSVAFGELGTYAFAAILPLIAALGVGLAYQRLRGGLDWE